MDPYDVISVLLEAVLNGTHLDADMPFDPVITVTPGRVVIDGRFGVISGDELRPIHVEIGIDSLRQAAESVSPESVGDYPPAVVAWGICTLTSRTSSRITQARIRRRGSRSSCRDSPALARGVRCSADGMCKR